MWLATNLGLLSFNPFDHEVLQFRQEDGIVSHDFSLFSHLKTRQGKLWLGTNNGIVALNPDQIQPNLFVPQPYLRSLAINQENIGNKFGHQIGELDYINLKPSERSLEFNIAALSSYFPGLNKIYYKLENHEDQWKHLENGKPLQFINLESGGYSLQLKTVNANGLFNGVQKTIISFEIMPFLYEQIWFWIVVAVGLGLIIWTVVRIYYRRKMREQHQKAEHQRELERRDFERKEAFQLALQTERNRIAAEMHDDLGGELTAINLIIKKTRKEDINSKVRQYLTKIEKYATHSVESMGEIIWAMNSNYDNLSDLVAYIRRYVAETLDENGIEYKPTIARDLPNVIIAGKKRRNIFLTIKEALHNTIKHSQAKLVTLDIHVDPIDQDLIIIFHDNGIGIENKINQFGNGINNIQGRMKDISAEISIENDEGTKISLKIPVSEINQPSLLEA